MKSDFNQRWGTDELQLFTGEVRRGTRQRQVGIHPAFVITTFLHPQWKNLNEIGMDENSREALDNDVFMKMVKCAGEGGVEVEEEVQAPTNLQQPDDNEGMDPTHIFAAMFAANQPSNEDQNNVVLNDTEVVCRLELDKYKKHIPPPATTKPMKLLSWWKNHQRDFPILAKLAKKYLSIQATSAPSERIFSKAGNIISEKRTRLGTDIAGKLL